MINPPQTSAKLEFMNGPLAGRAFLINRQETKIGSGPNGIDIILSDPSIQPYHARILEKQGKFIIEGYELRVNQGSVVSRSELSDGDVISLGTPSITFVWDALQGTQSFATPKELPIPVQPSTISRQTMITPPQTPPSTTNPRQTMMTPPQTPPVMQSSGTLSAMLPTNSAMETTRYLCAAAHLDEDFREYAINNVFEEEHRAVGESYGVDIIPVAKWCYYARQRVFYRDLFLCIILIFVVLSRLFTGLFSLFTTFLAPLSAVSTPSTLGGGYLNTLSILTGLLLAGLFLLALTVPFFIIGLIFRSTRPTLLKVYLLLLFTPVFPLLIPGFLLAWLVVVIEQFISYGPDARSLAKGHFRLDSNNWSLDPLLEQKLRTIFRTQDGNVVVYSGYSPFAGAGLTVGGFSFAVDVSKGKKEFASNTAKTPTSFRISELYTEIIQMVRQLGLSNVSIEDKLYVNGQSIRDNPDFLPNNFSSPKTQVASALMNRFKEDPSESIRYYTCIRVISWDGELVLSTFLRLKLAGKNLFIEIDYELLPPVKEKYHEIDTIEPTFTISKLRNLTLREFNSTFPLLFRSPFRVAKYLFRGQNPAQRRAGVETSIRENPAFDYGTKTSLREVASSSDYRLYFQRLDKEMYQKIIASQVFEAITNFLDVRNIDTSDLKERQDHILNNGTIVSGNTFQSSNVAFGNEAKQSVSGSSVPNSASTSNKTA